MQFIEAIIEFWNTINYHEEILIHLNPPAASPTTLPIQAVSDKRLLPNREYSNKRLLPNQAYSDNHSWAAFLYAQFVDTIVEIWDTNICNKEVFIQFSSLVASSTTFPGRAYFDYRLENTNAGLIASIQISDKPLVPKDSGATPSRKNSEFVPT